ncbi:MAG: septal ring lytic transglycosylase RlpA family protein [Spirulinaceae cyanobacterium]
MPIFRLAWVTSWVSFFLASSHGLLKLPDNFTGNLSGNALSALNDSWEKQTLALAAVPSAPANSNYLLSKVDSHSTLVSNLNVASTSSDSAVTNSSKGIGFCTLIAENHNISPVAASVPQYDYSYGKAKSVSLKEESVSVPNNSKERVAQLGIPQKLRKMVRNLFNSSGDSSNKNLNLKSSDLITVKKVTASKLKAEEWVRQNKNQDNKKFWLSLPRLSQQAAKKQSGAKYAVSIKGQVVAEISDSTMANSLRQQIYEALAKPDFNPNSIQPALVKNQPGAKLNEQVLFTVDEKVVAEHHAPNPDLLAIKWVNNLRIALGASPLDLVEAQSQMYNLGGSSKAIKGLASWYGPYFHGRLTANGETYDQLAMTAAHPSLPFNTYLKVTNLDTKKSAIVRINDRGPYIPPRTLDLSLGAARCLGGEHSGVIPYEAKIMQIDPLADRDRT